MRRVVDSKGARGERGRTRANEERERRTEKESSDYVSLALVSFQVERFTMSGPFRSSYRTLVSRVAAPMPCLLIDPFRSNDMHMKAPLFSTHWPLPRWVPSYF
jgi:hypothetical protein